MNKFLIILSLIFMNNFLIAKEEVKPYVSVKGKCFKKIMPDKGSVQVTVKLIKKTSAETSKELKRIYENIRKKIKNLGLANLELLTSNYSVHREDRWERQKRIFKGYRGFVSLSVYSSDIKGLAKVFDIASKYNEAELGGLNTFVSTKKFNQAYEECLVKAVANAKRKARRMVKAANARLGKVLEITEGVKTYHPRPVMMRASYGMAAKADNIESRPIGIETKSQEITATVSMTLSII